MKRFGLITASVALIAVLFVWIYVRHASPAASFFAANGAASFIGWGTAWLCVIAGASLLARVVLTRRARRDD